VSAFGRSPGLPTSRSARISSKRSRQHDEPVATTCCACRRTRSRPSTTGARSATAGKAPQAAACYHKVVELKRQQALAFHDLGCVCISKAIRPGRSQSSARPSSTSLSLPRPIVIWGSCWLKAASAPRPWTTCRRQSTWPRATSALPSCWPRSVGASNCWLTLDDRAAYMTTPFNFTG